MSKIQFVMGDTVEWTYEGFDKHYWDNLHPRDRERYYGKFGYGQAHRKLFTFICYHRPQDGHCVLMDMEDGKLLPMCHDSEFQLVNEDDC